MAKFQASRKYFVVFLALVAYNYSLLTHGRHIKPHSSLTTGNVVPKNNPQLPLSPLKTNVKNVATPSSEKKVDSPMMPNYEVASFEDSVTDTNAFRPTTPGSSPGVGHRKFKGEENNMKKTMVVVQSPDTKLSVSEGSTNGFKPTNPGHSPGVGHRKFKGEDNNMKKAMVVVQSPDAKLSVSEGSKNGFKPTNPGHSPGVGHAQITKIGQLN